MGGGRRYCYHCCVLIQEEDLQRFKQFINRKRPDIVVVAAESRWGTWDIM